MGHLRELDQRGGSKTLGGQGAGGVRTRHAACQDLRFFSHSVTNSPVSVPPQPLCRGQRLLDVKGRIFMGQVQAS